LPKYSFDEPKPQTGDLQEETFLKHMLSSRDIRNLKIVAVPMGSWNSECVEAVSPRIRGLWAGKRKLPQELEMFTSRTVMLQLLNPREIGEYLRRSGWLDEPSLFASC